MTKYFLRGSCLKILAFGFLLTLLCFLLLFTVIYGKSFGKVKSEMWLASFFIGLAGSILLLQPLQHILIVLYKTYVKKTVKPQVLQEISKFDDNTDFLDYCNFLNYQLKNSLFEPPDKRQIRYLKEKQEAEDHFKAILSDLLMFIVYLLLLTILVLSSRDKFSFYSTKHMEDHLIYKTNEGSTFETLMTTQDVKDWLQSSMINIIHNQTYDSHQKEGNGWLSDGYSRMLGVPRIRQMRVKDGFCRTPSEMKILVEKCIAEYTQDTKDVLDYSVGWKQKVRKDVKVDSEYWRVIEPWKYQSTWQLKLVAQFGVLHFYGNEGYYAAQLGRTENNTKKILTFLIKNSWIDRRTKSLLLDMTFYTVDANMFNVVTLILEKNAYGKWIPSYHIQSRKLLVVFKDLSTLLLLLGAAFLLLTLNFLVNLVGRAFKAKFIGYFKSIWNVVDLFIVLLAVATIALFFKRNVYVAQLILELEAKRNNEFVSFYWATLFDHLIEILSALLLCIATLRLWKILQFALIFRVFNSTLSRAAGSLLSTFLIGLIFLLGVSSSVYIINGYNSEMFAKPFRTITSLATLTLGFTNGQNVEENLTNGGKILGIVIYFLQMVIINAFLINMFIGIICAYFATVKEEIYLLDRSNKYSMWRYLKARIRKIFKKSPKDPEHHQTYTESRVAHNNLLLDAHFNYIENHIKQFIQDPPRLIKDPSSDTFRDEDFCALHFE